VKIEPLEVRRNAPRVRERWQKGGGKGQPMRRRTGGVWTSNHHETTIAPESKKATYGRRNSRNSVMGIDRCSKGVRMWPAVLKLEGG